MAYKDPEERRAYDAAYRAAHREEIRANSAAYDAVHREEKRVNNAMYYAAHREERRAYKVACDTAYRAAHPEKIRRKNAAYRLAHPEKRRALKKTRRARKRNAAINDFTAAQWIEMQAAYDHRCVYCGKRAKGHLTQDHITPLSKGGNHTVSNIVPACNLCNSRKGTRPPPIPVQPLLLVSGCL